MVINRFLYFLSLLLLPSLRQSQLLTPSLRYMRHFCCQILHLLQGASLQLLLFLARLLTTQLLQIVLMSLLWMFLLQPPLHPRVFLHPPNIFLCSIPFHYLLLLDQWALTARPGLSLMLLCQRFPWRYYCMSFEHSALLFGTTSPISVQLLTFMIIRRIVMTLSGKSKLDESHIKNAFLECPVW